jgi:hypothetical protein
MDQQALVLKPAVAAQVVRALSVVAMVMTVDLYDELCAWAEEVENVRPYGILTAKHRLASQASA